MFTFEGKEYKSKSTVAVQMLKDGIGRMAISKALDIKYQTVHALMKKFDLKAAPRKTAATTETQPAEQATPVEQAIENTEASDS